MASTYWQAGWRLTADRLNAWTDRVRPVMQSGSLTVGRTDLDGTASDLAGTTLTFVTANANATYLAWSTWDYEPGSLLVGSLSVDGTSANGEAHCGSGRDTVHAQWHGTLGAAGTHTFKLRAFVTGSAGNLYATHTRLIVAVYEPV